MSLHAAMGAAATLVALAFALCTWERWLARRRRHELAWSVALALFAAGSAALWLGDTLGWSEWTFRTFFLLGAILNVPYLALGTIYLIGGQRLGDPWAVAITLFAAFATGVLLVAPMAPVPDPAVLPSGKLVFGVAPRVLAAIGSGGGAAILLGGALLSAWRLARGQRRSAAAPTTGTTSATRLLIANVLIAAGTIVLSAGGLLNSLVDEMTAFSISLLVGVSLIFAGFLVTAGGSDAPALRSVQRGIVREALEAEWAREERELAG